jgi:hypothetical protein
MKYDIYRCNKLNIQIDEAKSGLALLIDLSYFRANRSIFTKFSMKFTPSQTTPPSHFTDAHIHTPAEPVSESLYPSTDT